MHQTKSKKILVYFLLLIAVSSTTNNSLNDLKSYQIQNIEISGLDQKNKKILFNKIKHLNQENIMFINKKEIKTLIDSIPLVEKFEVFKKYPSTISINIQKTNFFAKINNNGKFYLIGSNGKLISLKEINFDLPFIFGKPNIEEVIKFKQIIDKSKFSYNQIDNLFYFPSNRWDIKLKENILLKLPINSTHEKLDRLYYFLENNSDKNFAVVDYRVENQIILNE